MAALSPTITSTGAGEIDVLVANAALPASGLLSDYSIDQIDRALDVNLRAPIVMAKLAGERMAARRRGHLVFISSLSGKAASGQASLYNATKFGMRGFALALREDMRPHNVGVSTVFPGFIRDAGMFADSGATLPRGIGTRSPRDVARATVRAVEQNLAEVDVAPLSLRLATLFGGVAPGLAAAVQGRFGSDGVTEQIVAGQRDKRSASAPPEVQCVGCGPVVAGRTVPRAPSGRDSGARSARGGRAHARAGPSSASPPPSTRAASGDLPPHQLVEQAGRVGE
ncbi:SDR family NAD(P)-dependent oxidoreductase [Streptoverticillium reticulum]|uniref:SDR family NAD(P)-dependent oxidoreductase n=1 Tax=Streptoverticillium reticulum TaxID=1433415 RepID=UPI0039BFE2E5